MSDHSEKLQCKICSNDSFLLFRNILLFKYKVGFFKCSACNFIQSEEPYWLAEAYDDQAVSVYDINIIERNIFWRDRIASLIEAEFGKGGRFIDYGGGTGIFVRLMRNIGYDFHLFDTYSKNIFAREFEAEDLRSHQKADILTAFEVFEHLVDPIEDVRKMFSISDTILFSTTLQPGYEINKDNWKYLAPETGQHISLYSLNSLQILAKHFDARLISNGTNAHILTKKNLKINSATLDKIVAGKQDSLITFINRFLNKIGFKMSRITSHDSLSEKDQKHITESMKKKAASSLHTTKD